MKMVLNWLVCERLLATESRPKLGVNGLGIVMDGISREAENARNRGIAESRDPDGSLDRCPYDEQGEPLLRAIWQDAFATAKLYGDG